METDLSLMKETSAESKVFLKKSIYQIFRLEMNILSFYFFKGIMLNKNNMNDLKNASDFHDVNFRYVLVGTELDRPSRLMKLIIHSNKIGRIDVWVKKLKIIFFDYSVFLF